MTAVSIGMRQPLVPAASEPAPFSPGIGGVIRTTDIGELHDVVPGWEEQLFQLGHGPFEGALSFCQTARMQVAVKYWSPGLLDRGSAPPGAAVLGFPLTDSGAGRLRGLPLASNELGFIPCGEEVDFRAVEPYRVFVIALRQEQLERYAEAVLGRPFQGLARRQRINRRRPLEERQRDLDRLGLEALYRAPLRLKDPRIAEWVENRVLDTLISGLPVDERRTRLPGAATLARRAEDYLLSNLQAPLTISDLCQAVGASERTLHHAFKVHLGSTPKAHLKMLRLNAVRRELREAGPGVGVMDVAMRWGFFHAGWLSQDYRRMFGESPSKALPAR